jgi:peptidoglycan/xylan/chitin deacetylase (PgdA/CDA1 family)
MAGSLPILTFHAVDDRASVSSFPVKLFKRGMASLHDNAYRTLNLNRLIDHLRRGIPFPARSFVITFDDGYQSVYERAFPILQSYDFSAIVFLTTGRHSYQTDALRLPSIFGRSMLSWSEIREMQRCGIEFGAHTLTHPDLTQLSIKSAEREICESKAIIENALSAPVASFAYPYGRYDTGSREIVRQHFTCASSDKLGLAHASSDAFALERIDAYYLRSGRLFDLISSPLFAWYIYGRNLPRQIRRAVQVGQSRSNDQ